MATTTDLDQTGRDANILNNYLDGAPPLRPANEYGRLGQLILRLIEELGSGALLQYDGRVDSVADLPATGQLNHFYLVGPEDSENFDEYFWVEPEGETGHWDRLGSVAIVIDDHLDLNSTNPVQNGVITAAINAIDLALAATAKQSALAPVLVFATAYTDGTLVTYAGELYKADSVNGSYITEDQTTSTSKFVKVDVASLFNGLATVAKTGSYSDLTDKPTIPEPVDTSNLAKQKSLAPEFDSGASYSEGDLMTYKSELYRCDPTGSSIALDPIAQAPFTITRDDTMWYDGGYARQNSDCYLTYDVAQLNGGSTYILEVPSEQVSYRAYGYPSQFKTNTQPNLNGTSTNYTYNSTRITLSPATSCYLSLCILKGYESGYKLYGTSTAKFVKVDVDTLLDEKANTFTTDATPTQSSTNPVQSGGVYTALKGKQNTLTFDSTPTASSNNPVTSDGIKTALDGKVTEGTGYAVINGTRVYVGSTTPTGTIPDGSIGIGF